MKRTFAAVIRDLCAVALFLLATITIVKANSDITEISLHDLLKLKVTTASRKSQTLYESPAFVEIISAEELAKRGYKDLSFLLEDLAGIQVSRSYGDNYFNTLWRGVRHTIGSSHLLLIDGLKFNHLYNNEAEIMAALPISNIKQVEVVYGPASVAYGSDAVVGIINIITEQTQTSDETKVNGFIQLGENDTQIVDLTTTTQIDENTLTATIRLDDGDVDFSKAKEYRWTDPALLSNPVIWGGFIPTYSALSSPHKNRGLSLKLVNDEHKFSAQYYRLAGGYGLEYTFDHSLPNAGLWIEEDYSFSWQWETQVSTSMLLKTLLRHRISDIDNDSFFIEGYTTTDPQTGLTIRVLDASYWESENSSLTASAEIDWQMSESWEMLLGIEAENKDLQKAYNINFGPSLPPQSIQPGSYPFPIPPTTDTVANNHIDTSQRSLFTLLEYQLPNLSPDTNQKIHLGVRSDNHSEYKSETSIRAGYVGAWKKMTVKLFYGEAFQEPSARLLYGGWQGSGSDPDLNPRHAETYDLNFNYQFTQLLLSLNLFRMNSDNLFNTTDDGAVNAGLGKSEGGDFRLRYDSTSPHLKKLSMWLNYSWLSAEEQSFDQNQQLVWKDSGDLADFTVHFGANLTLNDQWQINMRGRHYGDRKTIESNPLGTIKSFTAVDLNLAYQPINSNYRVSLEVNNVADKTYFHPGVRSASASSTNIGGTNANGVWIGSESFYNAQIPQPGREVRATLYWRF